MRLSIFKNTDNLPANWSWGTIGDICEFKYGKSLPKSKRAEGEYPVFGSNGVVGFHNSFLIKGPAIIIGRKGSIGKVNYSEKDCFPIDTAYYAEFDKNTIHHKWLVQLLKVLPLSTLNKAAAVPGLNRNDAYKIEIPLPPLETQKQIVELLDRAQVLIDNRKEQISHMDKLVQSLFNDMFGDPGENTMDWNIVKFNDVVESIVDIGSNGSNAVVAKNLFMSDKEDYAMMVRTVNFTANNFVDNAKYISNEVYDFFSKSQIFGGEIIMNKIGSAGKVWLMPYLNRPVSLGLNQFSIKVKSIDSVYLFWYLESHYIKQKIQGMVRGAVTKSITKTAIRELKVLLPPFDLQNTFAERVQKIEAQKEAMTTSLSELEDNFNSIMQRAFKGELL